MFQNKLRHPDASHISALIHARVVGSRVNVVTLRDQMLRAARFSCGFSTAIAENKERELFYILLRCEWIISARSSCTRKLLRLFCREKLCKETLYSRLHGIELIITKTCFGDGFCLFGEFAKVFERQAWRVPVAHLHSAARVLAVQVRIRVFSFLNKSWQRFLSLSFVLRCYNNFHQRS